MPLEGISSPGPLIPNQHLAEAQSLGAFNSRVEQNARIKEADEEADRKYDEEQEDQEKQQKAYDEELSATANFLNNLSDSEDKSIEYTLKFNKYTELVEVVDLNTGALIQSVPANVLIDLISDLKYSSGLFVDNEI
ncbi:MAG: flagellar protein FlaG [Vampirovibrionia bacterium]